MLLWFERFKNAYRVHLTGHLAHGSSAERFPGQIILSKRTIYSSYTSIFVGLSPLPLLYSDRASIFPGRGITRMGVLYTRATGTRSGRQEPSRVRASDFQFHFQLVLEEGQVHVAALNDVGVRLVVGAYRTRVVFLGGGNRRAGHAGKARMVIGYWRRQWPMEDFGPCRIRRCTRVRSWSSPRLKGEEEC